MAKLYQKQNPQIQHKEIIQPQKQTSIVEAVANFGAAALDKIAKDNFALGHANLVNSIITTAYESNPTDIKKFNEMVQTGVNKSTKNLPGDFARKIRLDAETKARVLNKQIQNNIVKAANAELKKKTMVGVDDITGNGPMSLKSLNSALMEAFINRDEEGAAATRQLWDLQHQRLANLADVQDANGNYVIGKETERNMYKQGLFGKTDAFRGAIEGLSADGLKKFDDEVFQNKQKFMEAYGIDFKTYDDMEKLIKARRKAFDAQDKREIKSQDYFILSQLSAIGEDELADIESRGDVPQETIDAIKKLKKFAKKQGASASASYRFGDQDESFLAGIMELQQVISTDDGSPDYQDRLLQSGASAGMAIEKMHQAGMSDEQTEILRKSLSNAIAQQDFADALDCSDDSLLSEIIRGAKNDYDMRQENQKKFVQKTTGSTRIISAPYTGRDFKGNTVKISDKTKKALNHMAAEFEAARLAYMHAGKFEAAAELRQQANRELIFTKYGDWISRQEFERLENELKAGRKAYTMIGNSTFEYQGLSQKGAILKGRF